MDEIIEKSQKHNNNEYSMENNINSKQNTNNSISFDADKFVDNLMTKGSSITCDNTNDKFSNDYGLPNHFDEAKFKMGQQFYYENIFGLFLGKLMGLVTILAIPSILKVLIFTNLSSTPLSSYKRYMATVFHMSIWYSHDFKPGSKLWKSMENVRRLHNNASKRSSCAGAKRITQLDMAFTQFGFMGYALTRPTEIGLHNPDSYGLQCWVYLWRVVGHLMGIEDEFNICRDSVEETRAICSLLIEKQFKPLVEQQDPDFLHMATALVDGMWVMQPVLDPVLILVRVLKLVSPNGELYNNQYEQLSCKQKWNLKFGDDILHTYQYRILHWYHNMSLHVSLWLMHYFPFLAIWRFGKKEAYVRVLDQSSVTSVRDLHKSG